MKKKRGRPRKADTEVIYIRVSKGVARALRNRAEQEKRPLASVAEMIFEAALFTAVAQ